MRESLLISFRSLVSGVVYQVLFKKRLSLSQWGSMVLLTIGAVTKELSFENGLHFNVVKALPFIMIQTICNCFASVYNEYLFKKKDVDFWIQNLFFYSNSILINFLVFVLTSGTTDNLDGILQTPVLLVILNMIAIGITTSMLRVSQFWKIYFVSKISVLYFPL